MEQKKLEYDRDLAEKAAQRGKDLKEREEQLKLARIQKEEA